MNCFTHVGVTLTCLLLAFGQSVASGMAPNSSSTCAESESIDGVSLNYKCSNSKDSFNITIERTTPPLDEVPLPSNVTVVSPFYAISSEQRVIFPERPGKFELSLPIPGDVDPERLGLVLLSPFRINQAETTTGDGPTRHPRTWSVGHITLLVDLEEGIVTERLNALYSEKMYFALVTADWFSPVVIE